MESGWVATRFPVLSDCNSLIANEEFGAGNETRTRDPDLGKVVLYQLSYSRISSKQGRNCRSKPREVKAPLIA
jgi:hypothetical protein